MSAMFFLPDLSSRRNRRKAIRTIMEQLWAVVSAEEHYQGNVPVNLTNTSYYEDSFIYVDMLRGIIDELSSVFR
jgi:hypothetical protein